MIAKFHSCLVMLFLSFAPLLHSWKPIELWKLSVHVVVVTTVPPGRLYISEVDFLQLLKSSTPLFLSICAITSFSSVEHVIPCKTGRGRCTFLSIPNYCKTLLPNTANSLKLQSSWIKCRISNKTIQQAKELLSIRGRRQHEISHGLRMINTL